MGLEEEGTVFYNQRAGLCSVVSSFAEVVPKAF
jgi:hypothetical protein